MLFQLKSFHNALTADIEQVENLLDIDTAQAFALGALQSNVTRKYIEDREPSKLAKSAALEKFLAVNDKVGTWAFPQCAVSEQILVRAKALIHKQVCNSDGSLRLTIARGFNRGMVGGGSNIDATDTNLADKLFNSVLTTTDPKLYSFYKEAISSSKNWWKAERARTFQLDELKVVKGNKLFYVPKETVIARTAATEPTLNMFGQLGYGHLLRDILIDNHAIDLAVQQNINKWMARSGSLSGEYATIDLSSASDTIGRSLVKYLFPAAVCKDLDLLRSPVTSVNKKEVVLNMVSTMGNGFTFPLQTLIFANLVLATMIEVGEPIFDIYGKRRYSVFGDDIICPSRVYDIVHHVLGGAGFTVNEKKSYSAGPFRESCGGDYYRGINVRAVYLQDTVVSSAHVYSFINRLLDWVATHKVPLPNTMRYLRGLVQLRPIPLYEDENCGVRVPLKFLKARKSHKNGNFIYHPIVRVKHEIKPEERALTKYYHAFHVALLHGSFKNGRMAPREIPGSAVYKVVYKSAVSHWDFSTDARLTIEEREHAFASSMCLQGSS